MWGRVDDGWWCHPKVLPLSNAACGVWIKVLSWSCAQRSSFVPEYLLPLVQGSKAEANELVGTGLWREVDEGWEIHDWASYQDLSLSERRAEAGRKGGVASGESRRETKQTEATVEAGTHPIPSHPIPSVEPTGFPDFWSLYPRKTGKQAARTAWVKALRVAEAADITAALAAQVPLFPAMVKRGGDFRPHPATWLNEHRWLDEHDGPAVPETPLERATRVAKENGRV
jgi:hypothetical protein